MTYRTLFECFMCVKLTFCVQGDCFFSNNFHRHQSFKQRVAGIKKNPAKIEGIQLTLEYVNFNFRQDICKSNNWSKFSAYKFSNICGDFSKFQLYNYLFVSAKFSDMNHNWRLSSLDIALLVISWKNI